MSDQKPSTSSEVLEAISTIANRIKHGLSDGSSKAYAEAVRDLTIAYVQLAASGE